MNFVTKVEARRIAKDYRSKLDRSKYLEVSKQVCSNLIDSFSWSDYRSINVYDSIVSNHEIDLKQFINWIDQGSFDINLIVQNKKPIFTTDKVEAVIVPALAADLKGNRVGYGGGGYDRYLTTLPDATKIIVCYEELIFDCLQTEDHDIKGDYVVTENRVLKTI